MKLNKHEIRIMLREYNEALVHKYWYADVDLLDMPDEDLDKFINNFTLKSKT